MTTKIQKTFALLFIALLFIGCKSDDMELYLEETYFIEGSYHIPLLESNKQNLDHFVANETGIYTISYKFGVAEYLLHINTNGTVDTLLNRQQLQLYADTTINSLTLVDNTLYLLYDGGKNIETETTQSLIYTYSLETNEFSLYKTFDLEKGSLSSLAYDSKYDIFIFEDSYQKLYYYLPSNSDSTLTPFDYQNTEKGQNFTFPIQYKNELYSINKSGNIFKLDISKAEDLYLIKLVLAVENSKTGTAVGLQISTKGNFYTTVIQYGFSKIDAEKKKFDYLFYDSNLNPKKYTFELKDSPDKYYITTNLTTKHKETTPFYYPKNIKQFLVIEDDLYIFDETDLFKIGDFERKFKEAKPVSPKL